MFRPLSSVASPEFVVRLVGPRATESRADRTPIETFPKHELNLCMNEIYPRAGEVRLHSIRSLRKLLGIQPLILILHCFICSSEDMTELT